MFLGSFKTDFSGKNRLVLPKRFRKELNEKEKIYLLLGNNGEIWGFDQQNWLVQAENVLEKPLNSSEGRIERLRFFAKAAEVELDAQGRFVLPQEMMEQVNLGSEVMIIGAGDHFEVWSGSGWERFKGRLEIGG